MSIDDDFFEVEAFLESKKKAPMAYWNRMCRYVADMEADVDELAQHNAVLRAALQAGQNHLIQDIMDLVMFQDIHEVSLTEDEINRCCANAEEDLEMFTRYYIMKTLEKHYGVSLRTKAQRNQTSTEGKAR